MAEQQVFNEEGAVSSPALLYGVEGWAGVKDYGSDTELTIDENVVARWILSGYYVWRINKDNTWRLNMAEPEQDKTVSWVGWYFIPETLTDNPTLYTDDETEAARWLLSGTMQVCRVENPEGRWFPINGSLAGREIA